MKHAEFSEEQVNLKFDKLDLMINQYNSLDCTEITRKFEYFLQCLYYVMQLEEDDILIKFKNKKYKISYLKAILDNDGPEYALTIGFYSPYKSNVKYEIGVCVRGTPLLKKL